MYKTEFYCRWWNNLIIVQVVSKKIKISVIGTGLMGLQHIKAINKSKKASLHSIVDINKDALNFLL